MTIACRLYDNALLYLPLTPSAAVRQEVARLAGGLWKFGGKGNPSARARGVPLPPGPPNPSPARFLLVDDERPAANAPPLVAVPRQRHCNCLSTLILLKSDSGDHRFCWSCSCLSTLILLKYRSGMPKRITGCSCLSTLILLKCILSLTCRAPSCSCLSTLILLKSRSSSCWSVSRCSCLSTLILLKSFDCEGIAIFVVVACPH